MKTWLKAIGSLALAAAAPVQAQQILLTPANVIGSSGDYSPVYNAGAIFDHQLGSIIEPSQDGSYWISGGQQSGVFITIDLGRSYRLTGFDLFNTHNAFVENIGTGNFSIVGSSVPDFGTITTLASGTLVAQTLANDPLDAQRFDVSDTGAYRYLQFRPTSTAATNPTCCGSAGYGLNELRIFAQLEGGVPEPASWAMMILGFGAIGAVARRRVRVAAVA